MSGALLFRSALQRVVRLQLHEAAERDLVAALGAGSRSTLQFFYDAAVEAGLESAALASRGAAVTFCYCAGQLADDLADGDCDYLDAAERTGPSTQVMLHALFDACLIESSLPPAVVRDGTLDLIRAAGAQQLEVRTRRFTLEVSRQVAEGISGLPFGAHLRVLWWATKLEEVAAATGRDLGFAAHVAADVRSGDPRYTDLPSADRGRLVEMARLAAARLASRSLLCLEGPLRDIEVALGDAR